MRADGIEPDLPKVECAYLVDYLKEVGPVMSDGAITWQELRAWQEQTGRVLQPWEAKMLRSLSIDYLNESQLAKSEDRQPPYQPKGRTPDRVVVANSMKASISKLASL